MKRPLKIMTEAAGSLVSAYMFKAIREAGHIPVGSDITPWTSALALADEQLVLPPATAPGLWETIEAELAAHQIDMVIPSFDQTLLGWSERRDHFAGLGVTVPVSPPQTMGIFLDKWKTYQFFTANGIPTPPTSLEQKFELLKPRCGSGAKGIHRSIEPTDMEGYVSQALAVGEEYTVDCLFDRDGQPIYMVPRLRVMVRDGKSTQGQTARLPQVEKYIQRMAAAAPFAGLVNFQCFVDDKSEVQFIECNPRLAGGMSLGFAATENWIGPLVENFRHGRPMVPKTVRYGVRMIRYYADLFVYPD